MLGYSREEIMGREPAEFLNPDQKPVLEKTRQAITSGSQIQQEFKFRRKDGSDLWVIGRLAGRRWDGRLIRTVSMLADVTVRKRTEEELRASNDELEIFNRAAVGRELRMIELKEGGQRPRRPGRRARRATAWNPRMERLEGPLKQVSPGSKIAAVVLLAAVLPGFVWLAARWIFGRRPIRRGAPA